jgi:hypothetical protein
MIVILGLDGLEYEYVKEFNCKNLMQKCYGKTDISEFSEPRTVVIWSSFLTGRNTEKEALKDLWNFRVKPEETFFSKFQKWHAIDVPGFTFVRERHEKERAALKAFFDKKISVEEYDAIAFENHKLAKQEFLEALEQDFEILMAYFGIADVIGHLSFGIKPKMKIIYEELDEIARLASKKASKLLIISDHGMKAIGRFGDHSNYGFWSFSETINLQTPKVTEFRQLIEKLKEE